MNATRYECLQYDKCGREWSYYNEGSRVGPLYKSKAEMLADLERYYLSTWAPSSERDKADKTKDAIQGALNGLEAAEALLKPLAERFLDGENGSFQAVPFIEAFDAMRFVEDAIKRLKEVQE